MRRVSKDNNRTNQLSKESNFDKSLGADSSYDTGPLTNHDKVNKKCKRLQLSDSMDVSAGEK